MTTKKELEQIKQEKRYWEEISYKIPMWRLMGWTYKQHATFITGSHPQENTIQITGPQRDDIIAAIEEAKDQGYEDGRSCCEDW